MLTNISHLLLYGWIIFARNLHDVGSIIKVNRKHTSMKPKNSLYVKDVWGDCGTAIFDVCVQETGNEGGGRQHVPWWWKKAAEDQLMITVESILEAERVRRR